MLRYGLTLSLLMLASVPALANTDVYGRSIPDEARLLPLDSPSAASPASIDATPVFTLAPFVSRTVDSRASGVVIGDVSGDGRVDTELETT